MSKAAINLIQLIDNKPPKNGKYYVIAIDGRGGAGKSSLSKYISKLLPDFSYICGDSYFEPISHPIAWGGYNEERFYKDVIKPLGDTDTHINFRPYDWDSSDHIQNMPIDIGKGLFMDCCYSFTFDLDYDLKIWVDTPREVALARGIHRSTMPKEHAEKVWNEFWKPMEDKYIAEARPMQQADIVIDGTKPYEEQLIA